MAFDINIGKANRTVSVDVNALSQDVVTYIVKYGLTQILNDAHSSVTEKAQPDAALRAAEAWELANKKLDALRAGDVRSKGGGGGRTADPVMREAMSLAEKALCESLPKGTKRAALDAAKCTAWKRDYLVRNPLVMERAKANVEANKELATNIELDVDALMG